MFVTTADKMQDKAEGKRPRADVRGKTTCLPNKDVHKINVATRMRIKFSKTGEMRCLSHNELMTAIFRALRRAQIPVAYTTGFHPHPKISFGPALAAGVEGLSEYFDIELTALLDTSDFLKIMNECLPDGLKVHRALIFPEDAL
jgi:radical SAM-linked protein